MFRQSVRQAMKGVTTNLEQVQGSSADKGALQKLSASIGGVVQQLAEVVNKLLKTACLVCKVCAEWSGKLPCCGCCDCSLHESFYT